MTNAKLDMWFTHRCVSHAHLWAAPQAITFSNASIYSIESAENNLVLYNILARSHHIVELEALVNRHASRDALDLVHALVLVRDEPELKRGPHGWKNAYHFTKKQDLNSFKS